MSLDRRVSECDVTGHRCDANVTVEVAFSAAGNRELVCISRQTDSFGVDATASQTVSIQVVTELDDSWTTAEILVLVFGILLILVLLIILILCICCGWCCCPKREKKKKEPLPPTQSMMSPPPPPSRIVPKQVEQPPVYVIKPVETRDVTDQPPQVPRRQDMKDFLQKGFWREEVDSTPEVPRRQKQRKKRRKRRNPHDDRLPPVPLKVNFAATRCLYDERAQNGNISTFILVFFFREMYRLDFSRLHWA